MAELTDAPGPLVDAIKNGGADAATLRWLDSLTSSLGGETAEMIKQGPAGSDKLTKEEARARADEIYNTMMELPPGDARYQQLMEKRVKYIKMAS